MYSKRFLGLFGPVCTGGITLKNVLDLSVLHSYLNQINNKTLTPNLNLCFLPKTWPDGCESHDVEKHNGEEEEATGDAVHHQKQNDTKIVWNIFFLTKLPGLLYCTRECCPPCFCNIIFGTSDHQQISLFIITANCNRSEADLIVWPALCWCGWVDCGPDPPRTNQFISPQKSWSLGWVHFVFNKEEKNTKLSSPNFKSGWQLLQPRQEALN